jgi:anti-anti-sigma regulatory factor
MAVPMAMTSVWLNVDENGLVPALHDAAEKLDSAEGEVVLDFSSVRRIDSNAVRAIEELAQKAEGKSVKIVLHGVNVEVYKVLKLVKLTPRFSFS